MNTLAELYEFQLLFYWIYRNIDSTFTHSYFCTNYFCPVCLQSVSVAQNMGSNTVKPL